MRQHGEHSKTWGDFFRVESEADLIWVIDLLADQQKRTLIEIKSLGELEYPLTLGWKAREIGEDDQDAATQWYTENIEHRG
mgnify:CR=1 FL=1